MSTIDRRNFIINSAIAAAGLAILPKLAKGMGFEMLPDI